MRNELFCCLLLLPLLALAQQEMEIVPLRHRTTEQVIPSLQPLVEPGGVLSGFGDQLIIKASRRNLEQLRQALSAIDRQDGPPAIYRPVRRAKRGARPGPAQQQPRTRPGVAKLP